ncbi:MAG: class I SAM-dependent methyltransferase [Deltaproteobacteria bacterium]
MSKIAVEPQNQIQFDTYDEKGGVVLGPYSSHIYRSDPRHLSFLLARYKFVSKMLQGKKKVLEIGCGDSFGTALILQTVESVHAIDIEPLVIEDNIKRIEYGGGGQRCSYEVLDITASRPQDIFDGAFALDVIEHIPQEHEKVFMENIFASLTDDAILMIGTPNVTAKQYASPASAEGHINLKSEKTLRNLLKEYFYNAFIFSMNDEIVHTGYAPMSHYLMGVGVGKI